MFSKSRCFKDPLVVLLCNLALSGRDIQQLVDDFISTIEVQLVDEFTVVYFNTTGPIILRY